MSELLWVAVPGGRVDGRPVLRVLVVPRLEDEVAPADHGLARWPPEELAGGELSVEFAEHPEDAPSSSAARPVLEAQDQAWPALLGDGSARRGRRGPPPAPRPVAVDPTTQHAERVEGTYKRAGGALGDASARGGFEAVVRAEVAAYREDAEPTTDRARREPEPASSPGFDRRLSLLREHPTVLRALGLVFDVPLAADALPPSATGFVRVRWPGAPPGLPPITSPWTAYLRASFLPSPEEGSDLADGMVALGRPHWQLRTIDVDGALGRLRDAARADTPPATLPALRTAGVMLLRAGREEQLAARQRRDGAVALGAPAVLTADDLVLGYRLDVRVAFARPGDDAGWRSLCRRRATYRLEGGTLFEQVPEEGHVKARSGLDHGDGVLRTTEVVARWDGWSLAAPRPALRARSGGGERRAAPSGLGIDLAPEPRSLPRLRFGVSYQVRARVADLAGGGRALEEPSPDGSDSDVLRFARHEPIGSPDLRLPPDAAGGLGPGAALDLLVVRAEEPDAHPDDRRRELHRPLASLEIAERHGSLDGDAEVAFGIVDAGDPADPAAAGVAALLLPEPGGPPEDLEAEAWAPWPDRRAKRLVLRVREAGQPTLAWDGADELVVRLAPSERVTLELSSFLTRSMLSHFAIGDWLPPAADGAPTDATVDAVLGGRHPMVTPARKVTLAHAVRRPLAAPGGTATAVRGEGQTAVTLAPAPGDLGVHAPSTGSLELTARWTEVDDAGEREVSGVAVQTVAVGRGEAPLPILRHELGDTRHRRIRYGLRAVSRFRALYPPGPVDDFSATGETDEVVVLSAARPLPPVVLSALPAFAWERSEERGAIVRRRLGGRVRVELARPWFTTGAGEVLGLVVPDVAEPEASLWPHLSELGRDPTWDTPDPRRWPALDGDRAALAESGAVVRVVPVEVWSEGQSWFADVVLPATDSYSPLARLAVARYQPTSLRGLELSPTVRTDFVPLLPDRSVTVVPGDGVVQVELSGLGPAGPRSNRVSVSVEHLDGAVDGSELLRVDPTGASEPSWVSVGAASGALGERLRVPLPDVRPLRVRVTETEGVGAVEEATVGSAEELGQRTVFAEVVALPG